MGGRHRALVVAVTAVAVITGALGGARPALSADVPLKNV